jgi:tetratricopeptide (TPR) repeat protein
LSSCNGVKSLTKKGNKAAEKELYHKSFNLYYSALTKNKNYTEARAGLKTSGQRLVNKSLDNFFKSKNFGKNKSAIYHYRDAFLVQEKANRFKIELDIPIQYTNDYDQLVSRYVEERYLEAMNLLEKEIFKEAETIFKEIGVLKPNYKDINDLQKVAEYEPKYRLAISLLQNEKFRAAYSEFNKIPYSYKDTKEKMNLSLQAGTITIRFVDFKNSTKDKGGEKTISAYIFNNLNKLKNPFIKIVDRSLTSTIINEQVLSLSGQVSESTATNAGELIGANAI